MVKVAPKCHVREVSLEDADRMLASGSWCMVQSSDRSPRGLQRAKRWRKFSRKRKAEGARALHVFLGREDADAFEAAKLPGETKAQLVARLVRASLASGGKDQAQTDTRVDAEPDAKTDKP